MNEAMREPRRAYDVRQVKSGTFMPWTWPSRAKERAEVERLSGQRSVPILVLGDHDSTVLAGSGAIAAWAAEHSA